MKKKINKFLHYLYISIKGPEMGILPGNLAFFFMMMMVPLLTLLGAIITHIDIGRGTTISDALFSNLPNNIANLIVSISGDGSPDIGTWTLIIASLLLASKGTYSMIKTSNSIYGIKKSSYIKNKIKSIVMLVFLVLLFVLLLIIPTINSKVLNFIGTLTHINVATSFVVTLYHTLKYPVMFLLVLMIISMLYKLSPSERKKRKIGYGAVLASLLLMVVTWGYSVYIEYFSTYETYYGGISSLLFLMLYFYLISYIFVLGMNINFAREKLKEDEDKAQ